MALHVLCSDSPFVCYLTAFGSIHISNTIMTRMEEVLEHASWVCSMLIYIFRVGIQYCGDKNNNDCYSMFR